MSNDTSTDISHSQELMLVNCAGIIVFVLPYVLMRYLYPISRTQLINKSQIKEGDLVIALHNGHYHQRSRVVEVWEDEDGIALKFGVFIGSEIVEVIARDVIKHTALDDGSHRTGFSCMRCASESIEDFTGSRAQDNSKYYDWDEKDAAQLRGALKGNIPLPVDMCMQEWPAFESKCGFCSASTRHDTVWMFLMGWIRVAFLMAAVVVIELANLDIDPAPASSLGPFSGVNMGLTYLQTMATMLFLMNSGFYVFPKFEKQRAFAIALGLVWPPELATKQKWNRYKRSRKGKIDARKRELLRDDNIELPKKRTAKPPVTFRVCLAVVGVIVFLFIWIWLPILGLAAVVQIFEDTGPTAVALEEGVGIDVLIVLDILCQYPGYFVYHWIRRKYLMETIPPADASDATRAYKLIVPAIFDFGQQAAQLADWKLKTKVTGSIVKWTKCLEERQVELRSAESLIAEIGATYATMSESFTEHHVLRVFLVVARTEQIMSNSMVGKARVSGAADMLDLSRDLVPSLAHKSHELGQPQALGQVKKPFDWTSALVQFLRRKNYHEKELIVQLIHTRLLEEYLSDKKAADCKTGCQVCSDIIPSTVRHLLLKTYASSGFNTYRKQYFSLREQHKHKEINSIDVNKLKYEQWKPEVGLAPPGNENAVPPSPLYRRLVKLKEAYDHILTSKWHKTHAKNGGAVRLNETSSASSKQDRDSNETAFGRKVNHLKKLAEGEQFQEEGVYKLWRHLLTLRYRQMEDLFFEIDTFAGASALKWLHQTTGPDGKDWFLKVGKLEFGYAVRNIERESLKYNWTGKGVKKDDASLPWAGEKRKYAKAAWGPYFGNTKSASDWSGKKKAGKTNHFLSFAGKLTGEIAETRSELTQHKMMRYQQYFEELRGTVKQEGGERTNDNATGTKGVERRASSISARGLVQFQRFAKMRMELSSVKSDEDHNNFINMMKDRLHQEQQLNKHESENLSGILKRANEVGRNQLSQLIMETIHDFKFVDSRITNASQGKAQRLQKLRDKYWATFEKLFIAHNKINETFGEIEASTAAFHLKSATAYGLTMHHSIQLVGDDAQSEDVGDDAQSEDSEEEHAPDVPTNETRRLTPSSESLLPEKSVVQSKIQSASQQALTEVVVQDEVV